MGNSISRLKLEEIFTALIVMKNETNPDAIPLPSCIRKSAMAISSYDNIDRIEETLDREGTSHRVNAIIVQPDAKKMKSRLIPTTYLRYQDRRYLHQNNKLFIL